MLVRALLFVFVLSLPASSIAAKNKKPNIVLFLTDDQDKFLGGWTPMKQATRLLSEQGATAQNWFIHTPVCCPSRAELLSGRYFHNIVSSNGKGCMHVNDSRDFEEHTLAPYLANAGYKVGMFGKYLNSFPRPRWSPRHNDEMENALELPQHDNATVFGVSPVDGHRFPSEHYIPPGYDRWFANNGGSYYKCAFTDQKSTYSCRVDEYSGYSTSVIGNTSVQWIKKQLQASQPFMAYIAPKAPHIEDLACEGKPCPPGQNWGAQPSPWYKGYYKGRNAPRTPNYGFHATDHHHLIAHQPPITAEQDKQIDALFQSRWEALLSVDDLIASVISTISQFPGELENTYFLSTSDHGYNLGQLRLPMCKLNVYDNDIRIPMVIRGPGIPKNSSFEFLGSNVDVAPTILGMAGVQKPARMDGKSVLPHLIKETKGLPESVLQHLEQSAHQQRLEGAAKWRTQHLIEYFSLGNVNRMQHYVDDYSNTYRAIRVMDPKLGDLLYAEFSRNETVYHPNMYAHPGFFEFYNLTADPYQMHNIYHSSPKHLTEELRHILQQQWSCKGPSCA